MNETTNLYSSGYTQRLFIEPDFNGSLERGGKRRCLGCMHLYDAEFDICPMCGYAVNTEIEYANLLYPGTMLNQKYMVGKAIVVNDFSATYLAWDTEFRRRVAINEYLPREFSLRAMKQTQVTIFPGKKGEQYEAGLERFVEEYCFLSGLRRERALATVFDVFEENRTAYAVTELLEGETLETLIKENGRFSFEESMELLAPVISLIKTLNRSNVFHMNITPSNIFLSEKGEIKLINFGSVMHATVSDSRCPGYMVEENGYAAEEIYRSNGDAGAHTDVYSLAAVLYKMISGETPAGSTERRAAYEKTGKDILVPVDKFVDYLSKNQVNAIHNALNISVNDRTPDVKTFLHELQSARVVKRRKNKIRKTDRLKWPVGVRIAIAAVSAVALVLSVLLFTGIIGPKNTLSKEFVIPAGQTTVPNFVMMDMAEVEKLMAESNLRFVVSDAVPNSAMSKGTVVRQEPDVGAVVNFGETVYLTMSSGAGDAYVDDMKGFAVDSARKLLEDRGFVVKTQEQTNSGYAKDVVFSQSVKDSIQEKGTEITLYVSKGNSSIVRSHEIIVPDLKDADYETARNTLKVNGIFVAIDKVVHNEKVSDGRIVSQTPAKGEKAHAGDIITVTINRQINMIHVPDVENMNIEAAESALETLGLKTEIKYEQSSRINKDCVISQGTRSGEIVPFGTSVTLTVSEGYKGEVPDVTGMSLEEAQKTLLECGFSSSVVGDNAKNIKKMVVASQSVPSGEEKDMGTEVSLVLKEMK